MKRNEKNILSRKKIIDSALSEFDQKGYGLSSVNNICADGDISKGILYHYFKDKDELYICCVRQLFNELTAYLSKKISDSKSGTQLEEYFDARLDFFKKHKIYHRLFCDAVIAPPPHLAEEITAAKSAFDTLNITVLTELLTKEKLREGITVSSAVDTFRLYQDFINARYQMQSEIDIEQREQMCRRSLSVLLYGVAERGTIK